MAAAPGMAADDVVSVDWEDHDGRHDEPVRVSTPWVGAFWSIRVPNRCLSSSSNRISYSVTRFTEASTYPNP
ncbi:hypothetical protein P8605_17215 [Streptomyces sp. T-3]|nr:hypothetical protein [Streptomyces sp. T-3]